MLSHLIAVVALAVGVAGQREIVELPGLVRMPKWKQYAGYVEVRTRAATDRRCQLPRAAADGRRRRSTTTLIFPVLSTQYTSPMQKSQHFTYHWCVSVGLRGPVFFPLTVVQDRGEPEQPADGSYSLLV
jgi:hypothetical protein